MDVINWITALDWSNIGNIILQIVGLASIVSSMTVNTSDDKLVQLLIDGLNTVGFNIGRSRNA